VAFARGRRVVGERTFAPGGLRHSRPLGESAPAHVVKIVRLFGRRREKKLTATRTVSNAVRARQIRAAFLGSRRLAGLSRRLVLIYPLVGVVNISSTFGRELLRMLAKNLSSLLQGLLGVGW
jgi:hypothetical protein